MRAKNSTFMHVIVMIQLQTSSRACLPVMSYRHSAIKSL